MAMPTTFEEMLTSCIERVAAEFVTVYSKTGNLNNLTTTTKASLVAAINEVVASMAIVQSDLEADLTARLLALKNEILGGAGAAWDTLQELQVFIQNNQDAITSLLAAVANRVRYDAAQTLTDAQKLQARTNIGAIATADIGNLFDCVAAFEAALAA